MIKKQEILHISRRNAIQLETDTIVSWLVAVEEKASTTNDESKEGEVNWWQGEADLQGGGGGGGDDLEGVERVLPLLPGQVGQVSNK